MFAYDALPLGDFPRLLVFLTLVLTLLPSLLTLLPSRALVTAAAKLDNVCTVLSAVARIPSAARLPSVVRSGTTTTVGSAANRNAAAGVLLCARALLAAATLWLVLLPRGERLATRGLDRRGVLGDRELARLCRGERDARAAALDDVTSFRLRVAECVRAAECVRVAVPIV